MAEAAEAMLAGTGWLPQPLRTAGQAFASVEEAEADGEASAPGKPMRHMPAM